MKKHSIFLLLFIILVTTLSGCSVQNAIQENEIEVESLSVQDEEPDFFDHFFELADNGTTLLVEGEYDMPNHVTIINSNNELHIKIQHIGTSILGLTFLVDYEQVPFIIDGTTYDVYYMNTTEQYEVSLNVILDVNLDPNINHKLTTKIYRELQVLSSEEKQLYMNGEAICSDIWISYDSNITDYMSLAHPQYEIPIRYYTEKPNCGMHITQDTDGNRTVIFDTIVASPGETLNFRYHTGGFEKDSEIIVFLDIGERQQLINGKPYLTCYCKKDELMEGNLTVNAPLQPGKYEVCAWAVPNPFDHVETTFCNNLYGTFRFTLEVK